MVQHVYFGNLHSHSSYSNGSGTPAEAFDYARNDAGLDFLAVTLHSHKSAEGTGEHDPGPVPIQIASTPAVYKGPQADARIPTG